MNSMSGLFDVEIGVVVLCGGTSKGPSKPPVANGRSGSIWGIFEDSLL